MAQKDTNPYRNSDTNKRYYTYDYYARQTFGGKVARIPLDAGFSCPNKDGTCGVGGCIFCRGGSSAAHGATVREQFDSAKATATRKWTPVGYVPYLQANTNTYAPPEVLRRVYDEAASLPGAVMLDVATRADCLGDEVVHELVRVSERIPVTVELGLQTTNDETARAIRRGYTYDEFCRGYERLRAAGGRISIGVHLINGLPGESRRDMIKSACEVAALEPELVKLHLLCVLSDTELCRMHERGEYTPMERDEYVSVVCDQLERLPENTVIGRVTGDAESDILVAPLWSRRKTEITNMIDKELYARGSCQGSSR